MSWTRGSHAMKAGFEARLNRDGGYFGTSPNGEYDFGGGSAYSAATDAAGNPVTIQSERHPQCALRQLASRYGEWLSLRQSGGVYSRHRLAAVFQRLAHWTGGNQPRFLCGVCAGELEGNPEFCAGLRCALGDTHAVRRTRSADFRSLESKRRDGVCRQSAARLSDGLERLGSEGSGHLADTTANFRCTPGAASPSSSPTSFRITI